MFDFIHLKILTLFIFYSTKFLPKAQFQTQGELMSAKS